MGELTNNFGGKERKRNEPTKRSPSLVKSSQPRVSWREREEEALSGLKSET